MKRGYADTPEGQIHYYVEGEGEPLIMMHAAGSSRQFWKLQPILAQHFTVYAFDTLGCSGSDDLPNPETVSIHDLAQSIVHGMDSLGIQKAHIFGLHTGNKIGAELGAAFPDRIGKLILVGNSHSIMADQQELNDALGHVVADSLVRYEPDPAGGHLLKYWTHDFERVMSTWWGTAQATSTPLTPELMARRKLRVIDQVQLRENHEVYRAIFAFDFGKRMYDIKVPTLIIETRVPSEAHLPAQVDILAGRIPGGKGATVVARGGQAMDAQAEEYANLAVDFINS